MADHKTYIFIYSPDSFGDLPRFQSLLFGLSFFSPVVGSSNTKNSDNPTVLVCPCGCLALSVSLCGARQLSAVLFVEVGAGSIPVVSRNVAQLVRVPQTGGRGFESRYRRLYAYIAQLVERRSFYFLCQSLFITFSTLRKSMKTSKYWQTQETSGVIADPVNSDSDAERLNSCERKAYGLDTEVLPCSEKFNFC